MTAEALEEYKKKLPVQTSEVSSEASVWKEILEQKLSGVAFHNYSMRLFLTLGLHGFAEMHKSQTVDEYKDFLNILEDYIDMFGEDPKIDMKEPNHYTIMGETTRDKMLEGLTIYDNWERGTLNFLKEKRKYLNETQERIMYLTEDVRGELKFVEKLEEDLERHNCSEGYAESLCRWLGKKFYTK